MKKMSLVSISGTSLLVLSLLCVLFLSEARATQARATSPNTAKAWHIVPSPNVQANYNALNGVVALSTTNAWAVGQESSYSNPNQALSEHWNGTSWSIVPTPTVGTESAFNAVAQIPNTNHLWAVGNYLSGGAYQTLTEYWNGNTWSVVASPSPGTNGNGLQGVAAISATNVWAIGSYTSGNGDLNLIEQWNGTAWNLVANPNPPNTNTTFLSAVTRIPASGGDLWAVGNYYDSNNNQTLTERYS